MSWIQTYTGRKVEPLNLKPSDVCIEDIAHALSMVCRFGGHCREFYSVAEHSVRVSKIVRPELKLAALLHDAHEAYLPDLLRPIKHNVAFRLRDDPHNQFGYDKGAVTRIQRTDRELSFETPARDDTKVVRIHTGFFPADAVCDQLDAVIYAAFGVKGWSSQSIKDADLILLATEARDLMGPPPEPWALDCPVLNERIMPSSPDFAEQAFLEEFEKLTEKAAEAA